MHEALQRALEAVTPVNTSLEAEAQAHLDSLTKPPGSLGRLEELARRIYALQDGGARHPHKDRPFLQVDPARICTIAGDHGVVDQGVSLFPREVTRQMVMNFVAGGAAVNVLSKVAGAELVAVDAGSCGEGYPESPGLVQRKIAPGSEDFTKAPAMSAAQCGQALALGLELAEKAAADGMRTLGMGEMGIGNTTPATALYCALFGLEPLAVAGPGAGLPPEGVRRKAEVVARGLERHRETVASGDPLEILACLGGYEIAALVGLAVGAARHRLLLLVDGFISTAAYAVAWKLCPPVAHCAVFAHVSAEPGHRAALEAMGARPLLDLDMRLGEGTGGALSLMLARSAAAIYNDMATFAEAGVSSGD